jgi:hypothetical protein
MGRLCAFAGEVVRLQLRFSVPLYELPVFRLTVDVALLPGVTGEGVVAETTTSDTFTVAVPLDAIYKPSPE